MPDAVQRHVEEVRTASLELVQNHGMGPEQAELAAIGHDICRITSPHDLLRMAAEFRLEVTPIDETFPVFLHGPVGAEVLFRDYGVTDETILDAVRYHTVGRRDMTQLDKVLFLADKLDPSKVRRYPFINEVHKLALENLDRGILCFIDNQVRDFIHHSNLVHPGMTSARNDALLALGGHG